MLATPSLEADVPGPHLPVVCARPLVMVLGHIHQLLLLLALKGRKGKWVAELLKPVIPVLKLLDDGQLPVFVVLHTAELHQFVGLGFRV